MVKIDPPTFEERLYLRKVASASIDRVFARVTLVCCPRHNQLRVWYHLVCIGTGLRAREEIQNKV